MVSDKEAATLSLFLLSTICVIWPIRIPIGLPSGRRVRISFDLRTAPVIAIVILWASQCIDSDVIRLGIVGTDGVKPYNILILFLSLAYLAITLDITGILQAAAFWVSNKGGTSGRKLYLYFFILLTLLSIVLGNDPVILSGTAFLVYYTKVAELDPIPWLISEFAAANTASMVLFVGNPTNVVICEGFGINTAGYTGYTILPFLACMVACYISMIIQFRKEEYVPQRLNVTEDLDVRSVLLDPRGAWVGSIILAACLVTIIVASFFNVDVWKISLPYAFAKLTYDITWDHLRHRRAKIMKSRIPEPKTTLVQEPVPLTELKGSGSSNVQDSHGDAAAAGTAPLETLQSPTSPLRIKIAKYQTKFRSLSTHLHVHFPTIATAFPRLPFSLVPFAFTQFILIEALAHQGWIAIFSSWFLTATSHGQLYSTIWITGIFGVLLCNFAGTNIGATILLTKIIRAASLSKTSERAAAIALAVASNIGAVGFTFSASLAGLLWREILKQKGIPVRQRTFARWNVLALASMTAAGLGIVCAQMAVLTKGNTH